MTYDPMKKLTEKYRLRRGERTAETEKVDLGEAQVDGPWQKSKGHLAFLKGSYSTEPVEFYLDDNGELWRAPVGNVIDVRNGYRIGRWEAPAHMADRMFKRIVQDFSESTSVNKVTLAEGSIPTAIRIGDSFIAADGTEIKITDIVLRPSWRGNRIDVWVKYKYDVDGGSKGEEEVSLSNFLANITERVDEALKPIGRGDSADAVFKTRVKEIGEMLRKIKKGVDNWAREQKAEPTNWGWVGNVGHVAEELDSILGFLEGRED